MSKKRTYAEENENLITTAIENAGAALENASSSTLTEYIQENVEYRASAGLKETIIREELSNCCKWCHDLAGEYEYGTEPNDIYRRHDNCKCIVLFKSAKGKYQDVWSKKQYDTRKYAIKERINIIDKQIDSEYNSSPAIKTLQKIYEEDVREGWISALSGFDNYLRLFNRIDKEILGKTTSEGIVITDMSRHFMQRVIGTGADPKKLKEDLEIVRRSGVEIDDIKEALFNGIAREPIMNKDGEWSQRYISNKCMVSINPKTGILIQCNRRHEKD